jgi:apolipoprotein N-acyltransferase
MVSTPPDAADAIRTWPVRAALVGGTAALLTLAFAPYKQFYLAWIGLAPLLVVAATARSGVRAFAWGWLAGALFFAINLSWIFRATVPGAMALIAYLATFWGLFAAVVRGAQLLADDERAAARPFGTAVGAVVGVAAAWVGLEWLRSTLFTGFAWIPLGQSQSPLVSMCQVADLTSVQGVSFWVVVVNALVALALRNRKRPGVVWRAGAVAGAMLLAVLGYGTFRLSQDTLYPGPRVLVVQPNFIHERGGRKVVTQEQQLDHHFATTRAALQREQVDLIVWSETVMPGLNPEVREEPGLGAAPFLKSVDAALLQLCASQRTALVTGGYFIGGWQGEIGKRRATDIRNAVYVYHADGTQDPQRYDKIHLVPYGEYIPFERSFPPLFRLVRHLAGYSVEYSINWASPDAMTVFELTPTGKDELWTEPARIVTPICYEDTDAALLARMFRPGVETNGRKRADLIVNISNDGWFLGNQQAQHLQGAVFRSIENRAPTARAVNTGISGFIDSNGRVYPDATLPVRSEGTLVRRVMLDRRVAPYTRVGDVFAYGCAAVTGALVIGRLVRLMRSVSRYSGGGLG